MRENLCLVLGLWHPYKLAMEKLLHRHVHHFWAPAIHSINPNTRIYPKKMQLRKMTSFFNQCRLSYPLFKDKLDAIVKDVSQLHAAPAEFRHHLINLHYAFEFFIPAVRKF
jgi:hypothetical protein